MKCASMTWALSMLLAVGLTPNLRGIASRNPSGRPPAALAQEEPPVALPGSADAPAPGVGDGSGSEGQTEGADPDAAAPDAVAPDAVAPDAVAPDAATPYDQGAGGMTDPNAGIDRPQDDPDAQPPQTNMQPPADENDDGSSAEQQKQSSDSDADQDSPPPVDNDNN